MTWLRSLKNLVKFESKIINTFKLIFTLDFVTLEINIMAKWNIFHKQL